MKVKKQKRHRKAVTFYKACFGFRLPFKVLCDGTFIHHIVVNDFPSHEKALSNALGGSVKVFTTRCVMAELKSLGKSYAESLKAAQGDFMIARCDHETRKGAVACITEIVGEKNSEHFFVATQDTELRKKLQEIPGVPLMFALRNAVLLEKPSSFQLKFVKSAEEGRMHMADWESQLSQKRLHDILITEENENQVSVAEALDKRQAAKKSIDMKDKVQFKRKRPKGPNPLSCKKKKKKNPVGSNSNMERVKKEGIESTGSRRRKRKRSRKSKREAPESGGQP